MTIQSNTPGASLPREEFPLFGTAAILAGGRSSRMGFDKQLLMEDERLILETVIETLRQEFSDILIVTAKPHLYEGMGAIQPSHPLSSPSPPAFNLSQNQNRFQWVSSSH